MIGQLSNSSLFGLLESLDPRTAETPICPNYQPELRLPFASSGDQRLKYTALMVGHLLVA